MTAVMRVYLRYGIYGIAWLVGGIRRLLLGAWGLVLLGLALLWLVVRQPKELVVPDWIRWWPGGREYEVSGTQLLRLGALLAVIAVLRWIKVARRRLVVGSFVDYTDEKPRSTPGLSTMLQGELARLYDVLRNVDESRAVPDAIKGPQNVSFDEEQQLQEADQDEDLSPRRQLDSPAPIKAEDLTDVLDAAVSVEASMEFGPVKIPIGFLARTVGWMARGPRVVGSVHHSHGTLVLRARTVGYKPAYTWRVDGTPPAASPPGEDEHVPEDLVEELAVRIFTDLVLEGAVKWRATAAYVEGLRAYQACLGTQRDRSVNLEKAKRQFIATIAEEDSFYLAHYNLGVVATELGQREAAEAAFLQAIHRNKESWAPYNGLAQLYFSWGRYQRMHPLCGRLVQLRPHWAESYHLRALSNRLNATAVAGEGTPPDHDHKEGAPSDCYQAAMDDHRAAVRRAWRRLCLATLRGQGDQPEVRRLAATSLRNLGCIRAYRARAKGLRSKPRDLSSWEKPLPPRFTLQYLAARQELRQGEFLNRSDAELHFELGKIFAARRKWARAAKHQERAVQIVPDRPRFWIQLARAHAGSVSAPTATAAWRGAELARRRESRSQRREREHRRQARFAAERAREQPSLIVEGGFGRLQKVYTRLGLDDDAKAMETFAGFEQWRKGLRESTEGPKNEELKEKLRDFKEDAIWQTVLVCLELAKQYESGRLNEQQRMEGESLAELLLKTLEAMCQAHPDEVKRHGVRAAAARLLHVRGLDKEALPWAQAAVRDDPLSAAAQMALAEVQLELGNLRQSEPAWRAAMVSKPDNPDIKCSLGMCLVRTALPSPGIGCQRDVLREAVNHLRTAMTLYELKASQATDDEKQAIDAKTQQTHYWLGRAYFELDDYEAAIPHLRVCAGLAEPDGTSLVARLRLGKAYLRLGDLGGGEQELERLDADLGSGRDLCGMAGPPGDCSSLLELRARARIALADSHIERGLGAGEALERVRGIKAEVCDGVQDAGDLLAECERVEGWAVFNLGDVEQAIECLNASVRRKPTAEAYLHLALIHADGALTSNDPPERRRAETRARQYAALARRLGLGAEQAKPLDEALDRLDSDFTGFTTGTTAGANGRRTG